MIKKYEVKDEGYEGYVEYDMPSFPVRMKNIKACNFTSSGDETKDTLDNIEPTLKALEIFQGLVKSVKVTRLEDKKEYNSYKELESDADEVLGELAFLVLTRQGVGKS